jgi:hypothetical protein
MAFINIFRILKLLSAMTTSLDYKETLIPYAYGNDVNSSEIIG